MTANSDKHPHGVGRPTTTTTQHATTLTSLLDRWQHMRQQARDKRAYT
jgi:hypothetical protein